MGKQLSLLVITVGCWIAGTQIGMGEFRIRVENANLEDDRLLRVHYV